MSGVPVAAVQRLLASAEECATGPLRPLGWSELLDLDVAAAQAPRFKVDVSFALLGRGEGGARFSVNDKGEEAAFRERLNDNAPALDIPRPLLDAFLSLSPPGAVQTTFGVKWPHEGGDPHRVTLYHEELFRSPRGPSIIAALFGIAGVDDAPPPRAGLEPGAVCVDVAGATIVGLKDYWIATETSREPALTLPEPLEAFRRATPFSTERGTRRYLVARRFDADGRPNGHKLLWMSEAHDRAAAERAWAFVDRARRELKLPTTQPARAMDALRHTWSHPALLYPDLVSLDLDADERPRGLTVYVSLKGTSASG
ncbi:MAG: hypothetical protein RIF41_07865 [Polyangiaceae bacterium]